MEDVGRHRAEHADGHHGEPVSPGDVAAHRELQHEGQHETAKPDHDRQLRVQPVNRVVRRRLAHRGRQGLYHPEVHGDLAAREAPRGSSATCGSLWSSTATFCRGAVRSPGASGSAQPGWVQWPAQARPPPAPASAEAVDLAPVTLCRPARRGRAPAPGAANCLGGRGGLWSTMHSEATGAPTRLSIARTTSSTRCRSPRRAVTMSPGRTVVDGLAPVSFTLTCPARQSAVEAARVGVARTAHSHRSTRAASPASTFPASHERGQDCAHRPWAVPRSAGAGTVGRQCLLPASISPLSKATATMLSRLSHLDRRAGPRPLPGPGGGAARGLLGMPT